MGVLACLLAATRVHLLPAREGGAQSSPARLSTWLRAVRPIPHPTHPPLTPAPLPPMRTQVVVARRLLWEEDLAAGKERHMTPITCALGRRGAAGGCTSAPLTRVV